MTDDDREEIEPEASPDDAGDPAAAFEALRRTVEDLAGDLGREMTTIRKGVEAAFEEFERFQQPPDYGPDLGRIVQQIAVVGERLKAVEQTPVLRNGAALLERSGESLVRTATQQLERQATDLERTANNLARHVAGARARRQQDWWLLSAGAAGLVLGVLLTLFGPRVLPGSVDMAVASTIMNADRWNAGVSLMQSGDPGGWRSVVNATNIVRMNQSALAACDEAAAKTKEDQRCTITVSPPPSR
jgi:hypothetical protein